MTAFARIAVLLTIMVGCVGCDQATKAAARRELLPGITVSLFHDVVRLERVQNPGAFLSMGASLPPGLRTVLFTFGGLLLVGGAITWTIAWRSPDILQTAGAALVCSGGIGNLIDRVAQGGVVTDFLNVGLGPLRTGIFNVADFALLLGAAILCVRSRGRPSREHDRCNQRFEP